MAALPIFASSLLEEAKRYLEKAGVVSESAEKAAYLHAALLLGFASFEAHVNAIADDFLVREDLYPHERGILAEHDVDLVYGEFKEKQTFKMHRLEDRVLFLCRRFSKKPFDRSASYWSEFVNATKLRNKLTHPKSDPPEIAEAAVRRALVAIVETLNGMYLSVYRRKFPAHSRGVTSKMTF